MYKFKKGDIVVLKDGGPEMTVTGPGFELYTGKEAPDFVAVSWIEDDKPRSACFHEDLLDPAQDHLKFNPFFRFAYTKINS